MHEKSENWVYNPCSSGGAQRWETCKMWNFGN